MTLITEFKKDDLVEKHSGDYGGPGEFVEYIRDGKRIRCIVKHKIEGGFGTFFHIYSPAQIRRI